MGSITDRIVGMQNLKWFLSLFLVLLFFTAQACGDPLASAIRQSCEKMATRVDFGRFQGKKIGIPAIANDTDDRVRREWLRLLGQRRDLVLLSMAENHEMDRLLETHGLQVRMNDFFQQDQLQRIGHLLAPEILLIARVNSSRQTFWNACVSMETQWVFMQQGRIVWADHASACARTSRAVWFFIASFVLSLLILGWSYAYVDMVTGGHFTLQLRFFLLLLVSACFYLFIYLGVLQ
jgi:hypothetical protein